MQSDRTEPQPFSAYDPQSNRLTQTSVIAIHRAHIAGAAWDEIAEQFGTNRKNIQRIVQGRRHRDLHPQVNPGLYAERDESLAPDETTIAIIDRELLDARTRIIKELRAQRLA